jgi:hypothetical protein
VEAYASALESCLSQLSGRTVAMSAALVRANDEVLSLRMELRDAQARVRSAVDGMDRFEAMPHLM